MAFHSKHTEEDEDKEALKGVEYSKEELEGSGGLTNGKSSKHPCQSKEGHHPHDADHESEDDLSICMIRSGILLADLLCEHTHHYDKYDGVEEQDGKDRSQEGTKEHASIANEATGGKEANYVRMHH